jgi:hypothetical protein
MHNIYSNILLPTRYVKFCGSIFACILIFNIYFFKKKKDNFDILKN